MRFWKRRDHHDQFQEDYARRPLREQREGPLWWAQLLVFGLLAFVGLGLVWSLSGRLMLEKTLKALASPLGLVWLMLLAGLWIATIRRQAGGAVLVLFVFLFLTAAGNQWVARTLAGWLEQPWRASLAVSPEKPTPFDLLVVLGGGTTANPSFQPQLSGAGDRVMQAAKLWHAGMARRIVVTGEQAWRTEEADPDAAEEARDILVATGVPADAITALRGFTTREELAALRIWLDGQPPDSRPARIGLVTSAWHMTRAMNLAKVAGINLDAVPADWMTQPWVPDPSLVIPSASNLDRTTRLLHELMGNLIGR
jgi:uncharacterized SAM-binding protein YcdF (DUF218 family)